MHFARCFGGAAREQLCSLRHRCRVRRKAGVLRSRVQGTTVQHRSETRRLYSSLFGQGGTMHPDCRRRLPRTQPVPLILSRTSRSQNERRRPSAVRATLDDPPIHIRPTVPAISGCKAKEPFRFRPLRHMQGGTAAFQSQRIFCRSRQESAGKRLNRRSRNQ